MRVSLRKLSYLTLGLTVLLTPGLVLGQSFQGGLRGAVKDGSGALMPGVEVTLTNEGTNVARSTVSNETGEFNFTAVQPAAYRLRAALQGFKTYERSGINVGTQQFITLDIVLEVGAITEEVQVTADAPLIETSTASNSQSLPNIYLSTLPNTGRNAFVVALTVPTVVLQGDPQYSRQQDQTNATAVSMAGGPVRGNNYLIDGVPITDLRNRAVFFPNIESVGEVKVQVNTYDAEMGRTGGGVYNTTMKSGTNDWHGAGFYQHRPQKLSARNFFSSSKANFTYWLYGGAVGGPIVKDKTFFWTSYEGYKTGTPRSLRFNVPTDAMKRGDFSAVGAIYDPLTTRPDPANPGQFIRDQFPNNQIPANRINSVGAALMQFYPAPNNGSGLVDNFQQTDVLQDLANMVTGKVDHSFNERHQISGAYVGSHTREPFQLFFRGTPGEIADLNNYFLFRTVHSPVVNYTWTPSSTSVVTARWGWNSFRDDCVPTSEGYDMSKLGFDPAFVSQAQIKQIPAFVIADYRQLGGAPNYRIKWKSNNFLGNYSKFVGRHNIRAGGAYREIGVNFADYSEAAGSFNFDIATTRRNPNAAGGGNAIASLLLGYMANGQTNRITLAVPLQFFTRYYAGYVQDDFRLSSKLTLNAGIRYEFESDMMERNNQAIVGFDRTSANPAASRIADPALRARIVGGLMYAGQNGNPTHQGNPQKLGFQPRFGFAYSATNDTVIRGGYGIFFAPLQLFFPGSANYGALGYTASTDVIVSTDGGLTPTANIRNPFPNGIRQPTGNSLGLLQNLGGAVTFIDQDNKRGYVQQYSFDIQHQLPGSVAVTVGYVGSRLLHMSSGVINSSTLNINQLPAAAQALGTQLQQSVANPFFGIAEFGELSRSQTISRGQLLRPFPHFGNVNRVRPSIGSGNYNALTLRTERRLDKSGVAFRASYTFAKGLDNYFGDSSFFAQRSGFAIDAFDVQREYSVSINDIRHRLLITPQWDLPFGKDKRWATEGAAEKILGGWNISPVITVQGGQPAAIWQDSNNANIFSGAQRPNLVAGVNPCAENPTVNAWYNPAAFTQAAAYTLGNTPRTLSNCRVAPQNNMDLAIRKQVSLTETTRLSLRIEIINSTNTPKFRAPESRFGRSTFGRISEQAGFPRLIQYMVRYEF